MPTPPMPQLASWRWWQPIRNQAPAPAPASVVQATAAIPVVARVVWEVDGEEHLTGLATRWTRTLVFVELTDRRSSASGSWLPAQDVRRSSSA